MIFVTVGSQLPFDRLIKGVDAWAEQNPSEPCVAQIGNTSYVPSHLAWDKSLPVDIFHQKYREARLIVSHAGIGNIMLALELQKPLIIMPRRADLGEHRNDHQMATVKWLKEKISLTVAYDDNELHAALRAPAHTITHSSSSLTASEELLHAVREFIQTT
jgi:UDP-N-acetylglucosamine transferase subunit ALG13